MLPYLLCMLLLHAQYAHNFLAESERVWLQSPLIHHRNTETQELQPIIILDPNY
jgi:hypothetical protein